LQQVARGVKGGATDAVQIKAKNNWPQIRRLYKFKSQY